MLLLFRKAEAAVASVCDCGDPLARVGRSFRTRLRTLLICWMILAAGCALGLLTSSIHASGQTLSNRAGSATITQKPGPSPTEEEPFPSPAGTTKLKRALLKSSFEKMKRDADELATLAGSLQEELHKSNQNVLSLKVVNKAEQIERLAKRIKASAKGY